MENINLNIEKTLDFISKEKLASYEPKVKACMATFSKCQTICFQHNRKSYIF